MSPSRRAVVTGAGAVTSLGPTLRATAEALAAGKSGIGPIGLFDATPFSQRLGGEVRGFDARAHFRLPKALKLTDRRTRFAVAASAMAAAEAELPVDGAFREGLGVLIGTSGSDVQAPDLARALGADPELRSIEDPARFAGRILDNLNPLWLLVNLPNMASAHVGIQQEARGPNSTVMTDWVAGAQAVGEAASWIRSGEVDAVLAGGAEAPFHPVAFAALEQAGLLAAGFVPGEGAGVLVLEEYGSARTRGARILGELLGSGSAARGGARAELALAAALGAALAEAGWDARDVEVVVSARIGAGDFPRMEEAAFQTVLGTRWRDVTEVVLTPRLGHSLGAAGAMDLALALGGALPVPLPARILWGGLGSTGQAAAIAATLWDGTREGTA